MTFGQKLQLIRFKRNESQDDFAKQLGTTRQTIWRYEHDMRTPDANTVLRFAKVLNIPLRDLMDDAIEINEYGIPLQTGIEGIYTSLNIRGREELKRYGQYLLTQEEYKL